jgi:hypothetical protein
VVEVVNFSDRAPSGTRLEVSPLINQTRTHVDQHRATGAFKLYDMAPKSCKDTTSPSGQHPLYVYNSDRDDERGGNRVPMKPFDPYFVDSCRLEETSCPSKLVHKRPDWTLAVRVPVRRGWIRV